MFRIVHRHVSFITHTLLQPSTLQVCLMYESLILKLFYTAKVQIPLNLFHSVLFQLKWKDPEFFQKLYQVFLAIEPVYEILAYKGYFDNISHQLLSENITMAKKIMKEWLKAEFWEKNVFFLLRKRFRKE